MVGRSAQHGERATTEGERGRERESMGERGRRKEREREREVSRGSKRERGKVVVKEEREGGSKEEVGTKE